MRLNQSDWRYIDNRAARFIGRVWVFERVRAFLDGPERLLLVCGPPGVGKTAVAARLAQAADGRSTDDSPVVPSGSFDAALFCRAGTIDLLEASQQLSDQLAESNPEFALHRATLSGTVSIADVKVDTGPVAEGAQVTGVRIDLARLSEESAFARGVTLPLRLLAPQSRPLVLLVDALDEAFSAPTARELPRLLAELQGVKIVATARDDARVLAQLGHPIARLHLLDDAPADVDDALAYLSDRFAGHGSPRAMGVLAKRVAQEAKGNLLYCLHVADALVGSGVLAGLDSKAARGVPLPRGGLPGVYREFLMRELTRDENPDWANRVQPVLAPLAVADGDGLNVSQLQAIAASLGGRRVSAMIVRDVVRKARQFLQGPLPDGPFRPYHQSFAEFLTDPAENPDWAMDPVETHAAIAEALVDRAPKYEGGQVDWESADFYTRTYVGSHAARARKLDGLLTDHGFLLGANPATLLGVLPEARSREGRTSAAAYRRVAHRLSTAKEPSRRSYLQLAAFQVGAKSLAAGLAADQPAAPAPWWALWAWWQPATPSRTLGRLPADADALITVEVDDVPLAVVGGTFGLEVWDLRSARRLALHAWRVKSLAVCIAEGRQVVLAGHEDGGVAVHDLPSLSVLAHDATGHSHAVLATAGSGESMAVTGDMEGTLVLWRLPSLDKIRVRANAHTMVRSLASAEVDGVRMLVSGGDTVRRDGSLDRKIAPLRVWRLPTLDLLMELERDAGLVRMVQALASPSGLVVVADRMLGIVAHVVASDGTATRIGSRDLGRVCAACMVLEEGSTPDLLLASSETLSRVQVQLGAVPDIRVVQQLDVDTGDGQKWAGPMLLDRVLVSAAAGVRTWYLDDVLSSVPGARQDHGVNFLADAGEILAGVSTGGSLFRWRWRTGAAIEPQTVSAGPIRGVASCKLGGREHVVIASADGIVQAIDAASGEAWPVRIDAATELQAMALGRHSGRVIVATAVRLGTRQDISGERDVYGVRLWRMETGEEIQTQRLGETFGRLYGRDTTAGLTVAGWSDKRIDQLAMVETRDELYVAALNSRQVSVWPLGDISAGFELEVGHDMGDRILEMSSGHARLALAKQKGRLDVWRLDGRPERTHGGLHASAEKLSFRHAGPQLASGGSDGFLRLWGRMGGETLAVELGEPITALAMHGEHHVAVGTQRGVVVLQVDQSSISGGPLDAEFERLRHAVKSEHDDDWHWDDRERFSFPAEAPRSHQGPAGEVAALIVADPAGAFNALSSWLEDTTPLEGHERTIADVACGLMTVYAALDFDCLAEVLGNAVVTAGAESSKPWRVLQAILVRAPEAAAGVCERWGEREPKLAETASAAANWVLWMSKDVPADARARLLICQQRMLSRSPTAQARTEALHTLFDAAETRPLVMREMLDRFAGKADGYASPSVIARALGAEFDPVFEAFARNLTRDAGTLDSTVLSSLADYEPQSDAQAAAIMSLFERLATLDSAESAERLQRALLSFAKHARGSLDRLISLAKQLALSSAPEARQALLGEIARGRADPTLRQGVLDWVADEGDSAMKEAFLQELARAASSGLLIGVRPNSDLLLRVLTLARSALESNAYALLRAAKTSSDFAAALAHVIGSTTLEPGGMLEVFADRISGGIEPTFAAGEALQVWRETRRAADSMK